MSKSAGAATPLHVYTAGFWQQRGLRAILKAAGWDVRLGIPGRGGDVGVWGQKPASRRGRAVAALTDATTLTIEDGFLRSVYPGDRSVPPLSLVLDNIGIHYDASAPSRLEALLQTGSPEQDDTARAAAGIALLRKHRLSKYTPPVPPRRLDPGYVLVMDQTRGDASIPGALVDKTAFQRMLQAARAEHPGKRIALKTHPDVIAGRKRGHLSAADITDDDLLLADPINPWDALEGAAAVYTVSSQLGYEAILAGKPVRCFGAAFYAGWGLTEDEVPVRRRTTRHSRETLFAACHLSYPIYVDPYDLCLCSFEDAVGHLGVLVDAERRSDHAEGELFGGVRLWKRRNLTRFRPSYPQAPKFVSDPARARHEAVRDVRRLWLWASQASPEDPPGTGYVEDGFLRSVGLGASLTQAASLVFDSQGIYYDPTRPSDLETMIAQATKGDADCARAEALVREIVAARLTKYNVGSNQAAQTPKDRHMILVPGQVEDDASIQHGAGEIRTNLGLLQAARDANPEAWIVYKPHPDVEAGLRSGLVPQDAVSRLANEIATDASPIDLIERADSVWTMTSLLGFEALLRDVPVTCLGLPFYAGWGLTHDVGPTCPRRTARPTLAQLVWAALIAYPRYVDPVSGLPCTAERIVQRLASGAPSPRATALSKLQALFAGQSWIWR